MRRFIRGWSRGQHPRVQSRWWAGVGYEGEALGFLEGVELEFGRVLLVLLADFGLVVGADGVARVGRQQGARFAGVQRIAYRLNLGRADLVVVRSAVNFAASLELHGSQVKDGQRLADLDSGGQFEAHRIGRRCPENPAEDKTCADALVKLLEQVQYRADVL